MELKDIRELLKLIKRYKIQDFTLKKGDNKVRIRMSQPEVVEKYTPAPAPPITEPSAVPAAPAPAEAGAAESQLSVGENQFLVTSPIVGTFYRAPAPESPPYVDVGGAVNKGTVLCIVEAMKIMNEIESEITGKVAKILPENAQAVEYGQLLFLIEPD